ncbi:hypothetical protein NZJ93_06745 [Desulfofundulus thermocisternus]|nr:hypothetical protein [Desulfofundulus thermocisternus]
MDREKKEGSGPQSNFEPRQGSGCVLETGQWGLHGSGPHGHFLKISCDLKKMLIGAGFFVT